MCIRLSLCSFIFLMISVLYTVHHGPLHHLSSWIFPELSQSQLPCIFLIAPQLLLIAPDYLRQNLQTPSQSVCLNSFTTLAVFLSAWINCFITDFFVILFPLFTGMLAVPAQTQPFPVCLLLWLNSIAKFKIWLKCVQCLATTHINLSLQSISKQFSSL